MRTLRGPQPGLLDPSQPSRLLRFPDSKLSFASFDPRTALVEDPSIQKSNGSDNLTPPKRIVVETNSRDMSYWRFVPRARFEEGAQDEGIWPRVIVICGEQVHCYQEQWEMYKLDPKYHCVVYPWPKCSIVTLAELPNQDCNTTAPYSGKRSQWPSPETSEPVAQKKARFRFSDKTDESDFESDEDEVEEMIIDGSFSQRPRSNRGNATSREKLDKARQERWTKNRMAYEKQLHDTSIPADGSFSMRVDSDTLHFENTPWSTEENKRKGSTFQELDNDQSLRGPKRARTSPPRMHNEVNQTRPGKRWSKRLRKFGEHNRRQGNFTGFSGFYFAPPESVPDVEEDQAEAEATTTTTEASSQGTDGQAETPLEDNPSHEAGIAESIRKLRELEKDRPLWEAQRKQREARERAEEQERLAKAERRRKEEEGLRQQRETAEREKLREQEVEERLAQEEERRQHENRARRQQRWESSPWTSRRALEYYRMLCHEFDKPEFTARKSITFRDIPWPVLHVPSHLTVEDVDWSTVEMFFATVKSHMRLQDYKEFVEKSHRRFHPDRWRARKLWAAVAGEIERGYLEVAANTVAQAITPIWRAVKEE